MSEPLSIAPRCSITECTVWRVDLDHVGGPNALRVLSVPERERMLRFRFARDAARYAAGRAALRSILAEYLDVAPERIEIEADEYGRPRLAERSRWAGALEFNVSHSENLAVIGITPQGPVGVDVELLRAIPDAAALAERCFTFSERAALDECAKADVDRAFLTCWTRKEATSKGVGMGFALDPSGVEVGIAPVERLVRIETDRRLTSLSVISFEIDAPAIVSCALLPGMRLGTMCELRRESRGAFVAC